MQDQSSLQAVVSHIEFIYTRATDKQPAQFQLPPNIADVEAVSPDKDILSVWITYQFAIPSGYNDDLENIQNMFISAMEDLRRNRTA